MVLLEDCLIASAVVVAFSASVIDVAAAYFSHFEPKH